MTLYGACIGTMIVMTDFLSALPVMTDSLQTKRYVMQGILTVVAIVLCMLKDPSLLVKISSFGLVALGVSFLLLFFYGVKNYRFSFDTSYLWPTSTVDFLNKFGVFVYSLGFTLFLLSQVVRGVWRLSRVEAREEVVSQPHREDHFHVRVGGRGDLLLHRDSVFLAAEHQSESVCGLSSYL